MRHPNAVRFDSISELMEFIPHWNDHRRLSLLLRAAS